MTDINDIEQELSELKLEEEVRAAEVVSVEPSVEETPNGPQKHLRVTFQTISGTQEEELLPLPERWLPRYDLVCLVEFTDAETSDMSTLEGGRVPYRDGGVEWSTMLKVLQTEDSRVSADWDNERRMEEVRKSWS
jgi:hypothetical protein